MPEVRFTARAEQDIESILDYSVGKWGKREGQRYFGDTGIQTKCIGVEPSRRKGARAN